jgi:hypothetical protein
MNYLGHILSAAATVTKRQPQSLRNDWSFPPDNKLYLARKGLAV